MNRRLLVTLAGLMFIAATLGLVGTRGIAAKASGSTAVFDSNGRLKQPTGYRRWIFLGAPLTPNYLLPSYHVWHASRLFSVFPPPKTVFVIKRRCSRAVYKCGFRAEVTIGCRCKMTILFRSVRASFLSRLLNSISSLANNSLLNPPISRNAFASQKINEPAAHFLIRL